MTREEKARDIASSFSMSDYTVAYEAALEMAEWADQHPVNPWHDASKELPEMGGLYLVHNGRTSQTIRYNKEQNKWGVSPWMIINVKYWMEIPELPKED